MDKERLRHLAAERRLATAMLSQWPIGTAKLRLLTANFNTVYRVDAANGQRYVLRLHQPNVLDVPTINSELQWLATIHQDTDLEVPQPQPSKEGELLMLMPDANTMRNAALFRWIDGHIVGKALTPARLFKVGCLMATLHRQARSFSPPPSFTRPRWDWDKIFGANSPIGRGEFDQILSAADRETYQQAGQQVRQAMTELGEDPEAFGLIHNDLHSRNYLHHHGTIKAIDFEVSGWGWWIQDMAVTIEALGRKNGVAQREAFLQGYTSVAPLPPGFYEYERNFILARYGCFAIWMTESQNPKYRNELPGGLAAVAAAMRETMTPQSAQS